MAILTSQDELVQVLMSRVSLVFLHYWPQLREGDPDVSYDVMVSHISGDACVGRFSTLERAEEVRDLLISAVDSNTNYTVPTT